MLFIKLFGKAILTFRRVKEKIISLYQLSQIPHGKNCSIIGGSSRFEGNITFGDGVTIGANSTILSTEANVTIGNKVLFGPHVFIISGNHQINRIGEYIIDIKEKSEVCDEDIVIEDDVWIGAGTIILKGVTIGRGSVIGAGSIVTRSTAPYSINAGSPCRQIKMRFTEDEIKEHERILGLDKA